MNRNALILAALLGLFAMAATGCVSVHRVTITDAPRKSVSFESPDAMRTFYDALLARRFPKTRKPSQIIAGQTLYTREIRPSANVAFNTGVAAADTNADGVISLREAEAYASIPAR